MPDFKCSSIPKVEQPLRTTPWFMLAVYMIFMTSPIDHLLIATLVPGIPMGGIGPSGCEYIHFPIVASLDLPGLLGQTAITPDRTCSSNVLISAQVSPTRAGRSTDFPRDVLYANRVDALGFGCRYPPYKVYSSAFLVFQYGIILPFSLLNP